MDVRDPTPAQFQLMMGTLAENTGMHGVPNIKRAGSFYKRCFWTIIFLAALGKTLLTCSIDII